LSHNRGPVTETNRPDRASVNSIFGSEWPQESANDEQDPAADRDARDRDRWLQDNVPPHHY
jgi:hypothetical protein